MAVPEDYVGKRFGAFEIGELIGSGLEGEVFLCRHLINDRFYVLKLFIDDDALWDGPPLLPPPVGPHLQITVSKLRQMASASPGGYATLAVQLLEVFARDYVRPLTVLGRVREAWSFEQLLNYRGRVDELLDETPLYNNAAYAMFADAYYGKGERERWERDWGRLRGGERLVSLLQPVFEQNDPSQELFKLLSQANSCGFEFAENHLLWMTAAYLSRDISLDILTKTLRCPFFSLNIANDEVRQLMDLKRMLSTSTRYISEDIGLALNIIDVVITCLVQPAFNPENDAEEFELVDDGLLPRLEPEKTILMEHSELRLFDGRWG